jgi:hypothetical protein
MFYINFGKHFGTSLEAILFQHPDYARWIITHPAATGPLLEAQRHLKLLIRRFDAKPIVVKCDKPECTNVATYGSAYIPSSQVMWWCSSCNPYSAGALSNKLHPIRYYDDVRMYTEYYCNGRKMVTKQLLKRLAQAKGLGDRLTESELEKLFAQPAPPAVTEPDPWAVSV